MKKHIAILLFFNTLNALSQVGYSGFIDKYPIEFVADISSENGVYLYKNYDNPIYLKAKLENETLTFIEENSDGKETATITFKNIRVNEPLKSGIWKDSNTGKEFEVKLTKEFDINEGKDISWENKEILQASSSKNHYFKIVASKKNDDYYARGNGLKIYTKKTDVLFQEFEAFTQLLGCNSITIDDYNFDGIDDFSVFEASYAGPNTSKIYYLFDPKTKKYFESDIAGVSLEFDKKTKTITEHNQCCAGAQQTVSKYKLKENKMVLIEEHCYKWDEKKQELTERKIKDCQ